MTARLIEVTFGARSTAAIEGEVQSIHSTLSSDEAALMRYYRARQLDTALQVSVMGTVLRGQEAINFLRSFVEVSRAALQVEQSSASEPLRPERHEQRGEHLSRTLTAPGIQVSDDPYTVGNRVRRFLPEETRPMRTRTLREGVTAHYSRSAADRLPADSRFRLPSQ